MSATPQEPNGQRMKANSEKETRASRALCLLEGLLEIIASYEAVFALVTLVQALSRSLAQSV